MLLSFEETNKILNRYRIPFLKTTLVLNKKELKKATFNYPVVLKTAGKVLHKAKAGLVKKDIYTKKDLVKSFKLMKAEGVLIQSQISGFEFFCGAKRDKTFGFVLSFGSGGSIIEILDDIAFGICPLNKKEILEMMKITKSYNLIEDKDLMVELLFTLSRILEENEDIKEIDFNPVINSKVVDAKIICY